MLHFLRSFFGKKTRALNNIYISQESLLQNFSYLLQQHPWDYLFPVIKSNAYGHGIQQIATILKDASCEYICVDSYPEYKIASKYNNHNYLVLSDTNPNNYKLYNWKRTAFVVSSFATLNYFADKGKKVRIHIFFNTGMNREWFDLHDIEHLISILQASPHIAVEWVMSHLSHGDATDSSYNDVQIMRFKEMFKQLTEAWFLPRYKHIWASAGIFAIQDSFFNTWRSGIALYWYSPLSSNHRNYNQTTALQPVASIHSTVLTVRTIQSWEYVWYNGTWKTDQDIQIALIPFGYYEWLPRWLSNNWYVKWKNIYLPVVGTISMNYISIATMGHKLEVWDSIEIYTNVPNTTNTISKAAHILWTNIYEIMIRRSEKTRRTIQ